MIRRSSRIRNLKDYAAKGIATAGALLGVFFLGWILLEVLRNGVQALDWSFFTKLPPPPASPGGGVANCVAGTLAITGVATVISVPLGVLAGTYLSELRQNLVLATLIRFISNSLIGIPSIVIGLFVYASIVVPMGHFSGYAGAVSLAIIMLPVVASTSEAMLSLVPNELRESAIALGAPRWKLTLEIIFRAARSGIVTGVILAVARVSGETAPLLFTSLNSPYWPDRLMSTPTANLTVTIFNFAMSPYARWQQIAWGASLLIMIAVLGMTITARVAFRGVRR